MATKFGEELMEQRLELVTLARDLHADGRLSDVEMARVVKTPAVRVHPLVFLAEQKLGDAAAPGKQLEMDDLLSWLGGKAEYWVHVLLWCSAQICPSSSISFSDRRATDRSQPCSTSVRTVINWWFLSRLLIPTR